MNRSDPFASTSRALGRAMLKSVDIEALVGRQQHPQRHHQRDESFWVICKDVQRIWSLSLLEFPRQHVIVGRRQTRQADQVWPWLFL